MILTEHNTRFSRGAVRPYQKKVITNLLKQAKSIIAVGPGLKSSLSKFTEKEIIIIPNMVDVSAFSCKTKMSGEPFSFLSIGVLTYKKGFDLLIKAFSILLRSHPNATLTIVGDGELKEELQLLVEKMSLEEKVRLHGKAQRNEIPDLFTECDSFVLASRHETFGVVLIEAMASGKPVISTNNPGPLSIVTKETGLLVENEDIQELSTAMEKMIDHYSDYNSDYIRKYCLDHFSKEVIIKKINDIYQEVLS